MTFLTEAQRRKVFNNIIRLIDARFMGADADTSRLRQEYEATAIGSETPEGFEQALNALLRGLGTSHTGVFHESRPRATGRIAMAATLTKAETSDGLLSGKEMIAGVVVRDERVIRHSAFWMA